MDRFTQPLAMLQKDPDDANRKFAIMCAMDLRPQHIAQQLGFKLFFRALLAGVRHLLDVLRNLQRRPHRLILRRHGRRSRKVEEAAQRLLGAALFVVLR